MRSCVYNLEYSILDSIGRAKKTSHVGIFSTPEKLTEKVNKITEEHGEKVAFNVYVVEDLFTRELN